MYFIGQVMESRKIQPTYYFPYFAIADKFKVRDDQLDNYLKKTYLWKVEVRKLDRRNHPFFICSPVREVEDEHLDSSYILERYLWDDDAGFRWTESGFCQIENLEEFVNSGFSKSVLVQVPPSPELFMKNVKIWRDKYVKHEWSMQTLQHLLDVKRSINWEDIQLYSPGRMPELYTPTWVSRRGQIIETSIEAEHDLYYIFSTSYPGISVALTQKEVFEHQNCFFPPVAITVTQRGLIFSPKLWEIKGRFKLIRTDWANDFVVQLDNDKEISLTNEWVARNLELFPGFKPVRDWIIPVDQDFKVSFAYGEKFKPGDLINIEFPHQEFNVYLPAGVVYTQLKGNCLNATIQKIGNTVDTLMLVFTPKGNAEHTSRF